jgi:hypothetical protein
MNELLDLLPVPAERDMPSGSLERRKTALLQLVEADLQQATRLSRLRGLRTWLTSLGIVLALIAVVSSTLLAAHVRPHTTRVVAETAVALGTGPVVASLVAVPRQPNHCFGGGRCGLSPA